MENQNENQLYWTIGDQPHVPYEKPEPPDPVAAEATAILTRMRNRPVSAAEQLQQAMQAHREQSIWQTQPAGIEEFVYDTPHNNYRRTPIQEVPQLDEQTRDPIMQPNWTTYSGTYTNITEQDMVERMNAQARLTNNPNFMIWPHQEQMLRDPNYSVTYTNVTEQDMIERLRAAANQTEMTPPALGADEIVAESAPSSTE